MLRHTGMSPPPYGLLFTKNSLDMDLLWSKKILKRGSPFTKIAKKDCKISHFEVENPLIMSPHFAHFKKKKSNQPSFEGGKSLDMGRDFRPRAAHPRQK